MKNCSDRLPRQPMRALFVHGMGRTPVSAWPLLWQLRRGGLSPATFGYSVAIEDFARIKVRLVSRIRSIAAQGDYVLIGHSLGGVLLRAAIASLPSDVRRPEHVFLLASPIGSARLARRLSRNPLYRLLTGDSGQLLGSDLRMAQIGPIREPTTAIIGVRGPPWRPDPFAGEASDGVVAASEVSAEWLRDQVRIDALHTVLPASRRVGEVILRRLTSQRANGER